MSNSVKITSMRCPDCGGAIEPKEGESLSRCPYCNAVLQIQGMESKHQSGQNLPNVDSGSIMTAEPFVAYTRFDLVILILTAVGMIWGAVSCDSLLRMFAVAFVGVFIIAAHIYVRGQQYRKKQRGW